jgi:hypothetical protein
MGRTTAPFGHGSATHKKTSLLNRLENRHRRTLLTHHIPNRVRHILRIEEPTRTPMPRPTLSSAVVQPKPVQTSARIGLQVIHDSLRSNIGIDHDMHVIAAHVGRPKIPAAICTALYHGCQHRLTPSIIHAVVRLRHPLPLSRGAHGIFFEQRAGGQTMFSIHRARFIAVKVVTVTGERNQVVQEKPRG